MVFSVSIVPMVPTVFMERSVLTRPVVFVIENSISSNVSSSEPPTFLPIVVRPLSVISKSISTSVVPDAKPSASPVSSRPKFALMREKKLDFACVLASMRSKATFSAGSIGRAFVFSCTNRVVFNKLLSEFVFDGC